MALYSEPRRRREEEIRLMNIINAALGTMGYFDCRPTNVKKTDDGFVIAWDHYGKPEELVLDLMGKIVRD